MARKPMITRTITTTKVNVLCMDIETCEPFNQIFVLPRTYKDNDKIIKAIATQLSPTTKPVHIVDKEEVNTLYGMTEQVFIDNAVELDPTTRKEIEELSTDDTEVSE